MNQPDDFFGFLDGFLNESSEPPPLLHPITMSFDDFMNGNISGPYNLYIIRRHEQALYVGISTWSVWSRWLVGWLRDHENNQNEFHFYP